VLGGGDGASGCWYMSCEDASVQNRKRRYVRGKCLRGMVLAIGDFDGDERMRPVRYALYRRPRISAHDGNSQLKPF